MSNVKKFNGVKITVESSGASYHSYDDWGLYITNTDCIGEPELETNYIGIPGRDGLVDLSEATTGRPVYKKREIKINLSGIRFRTNWDGVISALRNSINGRICRLTFDNDKAYFWRGRVEIKDFSSVMNLGILTIDVPNAEPYKYDITASNEDWLWDPFNFETGVITTISVLEIDGEEEVTIPHGHMLVSPQFEVSDATTLTVSDGTVTKTLQNGVQRFPSIRVGGSEDVTLTFNGQGNVQIIYRGGSL